MLGIVCQCYNAIVSGPVPIPSSEAKFFSYSAISYRAVGYLKTNGQQGTQLCQQSFIHSTVYCCWQQHYEQIWNLYQMAQ